MPSHPARVRRHYAPDGRDALGRPCANPRCVSCAAWRRKNDEAARVTHEPPYDLTDDRAVQSAIEEDRLAWGVTATGIDGERGSLPR